jgi:hypothetical protein
MATFERLTEPHFTYGDNVDRSVILPNSAELKVQGNPRSIRVSVTDGRNNFTALSLKDLVAELLYLIGDMEEARGQRVQDEEQRMAPPFPDVEALREAITREQPWAQRRRGLEPALVVMDDIPDDDLEF